MASDFRDYFNTRLTQELQNSATGVGTSKYDELQQASKEKAAELRKLAAQREAFQENLNKVNQNSLVTKLGLNETGVAGTGVNLAASVASGASRMAGNILALPSSLAAGAETAALGQAEFDAYGRYTKGEQTPEDMEVLNRVTKSGFTLGDINRAFEGQLGNATALQRIEQANSQRQAARTINDGFDISNRVNQTRRQEFSEDLTKNFDSNWGNVTAGWDKGDKGQVASGIAGLLTEAGRAAVNNPGAVAEYVAENIPQLAIGAAGAGGKAAMAAANVGYAADAFQKGIEKFQAENDGAYPPEDVRERMALYAASLAAAEQVGDVSLLKGAKATRDAAKASLLGSVSRSAGATGKAVATEGATEGYQTYGEGEAGLKPATAKEIYEGAAIGGLVGGAMTGAPRTLGELKNVADAVTEKLASDAPSPDTKALQDKAIETGDVSAFLDPKEIGRAHV